MDEKMVVVRGPDGEEREFSELEIAERRKAMYAAEFVHTKEEVERVLKESNRLAELRQGLQVILRRMDGFMAAMRALEGSR
jgi:hypothetical protein